MLALSKAPREPIVKIRAAIDTATRMIFFIDFLLK
jgi:hypothetical protein